MNQLVRELNRPRTYLFLGNILLSLVLIFLSNIGILPIREQGDFLFLTFIFILFALYRPGWAFLFYVGTIMMENINLAPDVLVISIRPYQFFGALILASLVIRFAAKRLNFVLLRLKWHDYLIILTTVASFISCLASPDKVLSLKLSIIYTSFVALYILSRNYVRDSEDLSKIMPFILGSSVISVLYGIWQNVRYIGGRSAFEIMPGRPNATFPEADWLGMYLVIITAAIYAIIFYYEKNNDDAGSSEISDIKLSIINKIKKLGLHKIGSCIMLIGCFILMILTVSRSAWLGALAVTIASLFMILTDLKINPKSWQWKKFFRTSITIIISGIISVGIVYFFNLTSFQLFNRFQSTGTGMQKITIACRKNANLPEQVDTSEELIRYGCRHINLEEIPMEERQGNLIAEIYRKDPNVKIRKEIYKHSWTEIKNNPILGIGWGSIGKKLGADERGAELNASNIFFEIWLGSGLLGLLGFLIVWIYIPIRQILNFLRSISLKSKAFVIFSFAAWVGLSVSNLFNSGIMLGFLWLFMAISLIDVSRANSD